MIYLHLHRQYIVGLEKNIMIYIVYISVYVGIERCM